MEVIQYVAEKYGKNYVSQIITFGTLSAKAVAREVARVFGFESSTLEAISSFIPSKPELHLEKLMNSHRNYVSLFKQKKFEKNGLK